MRNQDFFNGVVGGSMDRDSTVRILVLPGGGARGYMQTQALSQLLGIAGIAETDIYKNFDIITGTSIGGIAALAYSIGKTPTQLLSLFTNTAKWIFTVRTAGDVATGSHNASSPSNRPSGIQKAAILGTGDTFYASAYPDSNYGSVLLKQTMQTMLTNHKMRDALTNVLVPAFYATGLPNWHLFSNVDYPGYAGQMVDMVDVAMSTSAAPFYLPPYTFNNTTFQDGGIYQNNPALLGLTLAQSIKPNATRFLILTVDTGFNQYQPYSSSDPLSVLYNESIAILNGGLTTSNEMTARTIENLANQTLLGVYQYRFQPDLSDAIPDADLDNTTADFFSYLDSKRTAQITNDQALIQSFWEHFFV